MEVSLIYLGMMVCKGKPFHKKFQLPTVKHGECNVMVGAISFDMALARWSILPKNGSISLWKHIKG